jgi:quercetin dioxygenase-like cupin family protein
MEHTFTAVPGCAGTSVKNLTDDNGLQVLEVRVEAGGEIPLHEHDCAATMIITNGSASALGKDIKHVKKGDIVVKAPNEPHGFTDINEPFCFISISDGDGIKLENGWDMTFE